MNTVLINRLSACLSVNVVQEDRQNIDGTWMYHWPGADNVRISVARENAGAGDVEGWERLGLNCVTLMMMMLASLVGRP
eukprot:3941507-Rhodomonas_salina.6